MEVRPLLTAGAWVPAPSDRPTFRAIAPADGCAFGPPFPIATRADLDRMIEAAVAASRSLAASANAVQIAAFLEAYAAKIEADAEPLCALAAQETGLPLHPRLRDVELPRTTAQLRAAARAARDESWREPILDTATGLRSCRAALPGPVVVLGPNNFPLAFNAVAGSDFASAVVTGNAVIAKGHPAHPGTSERLARAAHSAVLACDLPPAMVQMFYEVDPAEGLAFFGRRELGAIAFTGSQRSGLAIKTVADRVGTPVSLEMSSINPVVILPYAIEERLDGLASTLAASMLAGSGQFCTSPGLFIMLADDRSERFLAAVAGLLGSADPGLHVTDRGPVNLAAALEVWVRHGAQLRCGGQPSPRDRFRFANTLASVDGRRFLDHPDALQTEAFGTAALAVLASSRDQMAAILGELHGNLTGSIYSDTAGRDDADYARFAPILRRGVGRLLNDKVPTGVAVSPAMVHGGPFPATGHPGFSAIGFPGCVRRFSAAQSYDGVRDARLPEILRDANPSRRWRWLDGTWTASSVGEPKDRC